MSVRSDAERVARQLRRESRVVMAEAVEAALVHLPDDVRLMARCSARACAFDAATELEDGQPVCAIHARLAKYHPWHRLQFGLPPRVQDEVKTPLTIPAKFTPVPGDRPASMRQ